MVRLESLVISLFGGVLGIGLGVFFGWAAGQLIGNSMSTYALILPWGRMGIFLALAAVVGILAALWLPAPRGPAEHAGGDQVRVAVRQSYAKGPAGVSPAGPFTLRRGAGRGSDVPGTGPQRHPRGPRSPVSSTARIWFTPMRLRSKLRAEAAM